jgi:chromosome partitioning protein
MTRVIACSIFKGGTGKTTVAVNLSAALSLLNRRVLLVDLDTQGQAGKHLGHTAVPGVADFVRGENTIILGRHNLDLLAGGNDLAGLKTEISRKPYGGERVIADALRPLHERYDYIILDTGPGFDSLSIAALFAASEVLAPVKLEPLAVDGLVQFVQQLVNIQRHHAVELRYIVPSALDRRVAQTGEIHGQIQTHFAGQVCEPIRYNVRLSEAAGHGKHIFEYDPGSNGAADFAVLTERVLSDEQR